MMIVGRSDVAQKIDCDVKNFVRGMLFVCDILKVIFFCDYLKLNYLSEFLSARTTGYYRIGKLQQYIDAYINEFTPEN